MNAKSIKLIIYSPVSLMFPMRTGNQQISLTLPQPPHTPFEGHILQHAMFIISGWIRVFKISPTGREITLYRVQSGQCCVLMMASILGETEYEASVSIEAESLTALRFRIQELDGHHQTD
jgi:CRP/FNR family transcriptional regulator